MCVRPRADLKKKKKKKKKKMFLVNHSGSFLFLIYLVSNPASVSVTQISGTILTGQADNIAG